MKHLNTRVSILNILIAVHLIVDCRVELREELDGGEALRPVLLDGAGALAPRHGGGHVSGHAAFRGEYL